MFQETADRLMRERGLRPIAELAISSELDAQQVLERFRRHERSGVLCTVDMAGEGYDCAEITVVGFATNKLTPLYVRQVVARAQRVTAYEREKIGRPIPAAVIIPDVPELVDVMSSILVPMRHELRDPIEEPDDRENAREGQQQLSGIETLALPKFMLDAVSTHVEGDARVTGEAGGDVAMELVRLVEPEAVRVGLPKSDAPRIVMAVRTALTARQEARPFDRMPDDQAELATAGSGGAVGGHRRAAVDRAGGDRAAGRACPARSVVGGQRRHTGQELQRGRQPRRRHGTGRPRRRRRRAVASGRRVRTEDRRETLQGKRAQAPPARRDLVEMSPTQSDNWQTVSQFVSDLRNVSRLAAYVDTVVDVYESGAWRAYTDATGRSDRWREAEFDYFLIACGHSTARYSAC